MEFELEIEFENYEFGKNFGFFEFQTACNFEIWKLELRERIESLAFEEPAFETFSFQKLEFWKIQGLRIESRKFLNFSIRKS